MMTPIQKLQTVLDALSKNNVIQQTVEAIHNLIQENSIQIGEIVLILDRLDKDSYVKTVSFAKLDGGSLKYYSITFDGKVFAEQGGYVAEEQRRNAEITKNESYRQSQDKLNNTLRLYQRWTVVGVLVAALYYAVELIKCLGFVHCR